MLCDPPQRRRSLCGGLFLSFIVICLFSADRLGAMPMALRFEKVSLEKGLSQTSVLSMVQDAQGFMWFGTYDGLNRYDGNNMRVYKNDLQDPNSISDNGIRVLYEDRSGVLWIGTSNGGLNMYDRNADAFHRFQHDPSRPDSLSSNEIRSMYEDSRGILWIGTTNGLDAFDRQSQTFKHYGYDPDKPDGLRGKVIRAIVEDPGGYLWLGTEGGLHKFDPKSETFLLLRRDTDDFERLTQKIVNALYFEEPDRLWVALDQEGVYILDITGGELTHRLPTESVFDIFMDSQGILWLGTKSGLARRLEAQKAAANPSRDGFHFYTHNPLVRESLSHNEIHSIFEDRSGVLWIGTYGDGASKLNPAKQGFSLIRHEPWNPDSLSGNQVISIIEDSQGLLWVGTYYNGLNRLDRKTGVFDHFPMDFFQEYHSANNAVQCMLETRNQTLWFGTRTSGLWRMDRDTGALTRFIHHRDDPTSLSTDNVYDIFEDREAFLWVGTGKKGLNRLDRKTGKFKRFRHDSNNKDSLSNDRVRFITQDSQGYLWIGTNGGLNRFDPQTETFAHWVHDPENPKSISHNRVTPILEDKDGALWVGTDMGLNRFDPQTEIFTRFTIEDGLENDAIQGLLMDDEGRLWMSTFKGISRLNPRTGEVRNFSAADGLQGVEFWMNSFFQSESGEMFFGGLKGLNTFFPKEVLLNHHAPPVVITGFKVMNHPVKLPQNITETREIRLSYKDRFFTFEFAALDFSNPEENRYAYKLEGFDRDWVEAGTARTATYTNLDQGDFTFRVRAANSDGVWNKEGASVRVIITPPFWKTWWFRTLAVLTFLFLTVGLFGLRFRSLRKQKDRLDELVEIRTSELEEEIGERKRIEVERENLISELTTTLAEVKTLQGFIPICASCKKIRDDKGYWQQVEKYIQDRTEARFSHGICPDCKKKLYSELP